VEREQDEKKDEGTQNERNDEELNRDKTHFIGSIIGLLAFSVG
jgi:hypothetical protein